LFDNLARELAPSKILLGGQVEGVFEGDPIANPDAEMIEDIDRTNWDEIETLLTGSHGVDVTGGMYTKVRDMYRLTIAMPPMQAIIFSLEEPGNLETLLKGQMASFGTIIN
ncbi:MAG: uridylate kinase, partial [Chloroflexota bacterium]